MRAHGVLWCASGLFPMQHFAIVPWDLVASFYFIYIQFFQSWFSSTRANPGFV